MIKRTNLSSFRLMTFAQTMKNVKTFLENEADLADLGLSEVKITFDDHFKALEEALKPLGKNQYTETLSELDAERDSIFSGLIQYVRSFLNFPDADRKKAAQRIVAIFDSYGKGITRRPYRDQTAIIRNILADFETSENQAAVMALQMKQWLTPLKTANERFDSLHSSRTLEQSQHESGKVQETRAQMQAVFDKLAKSISALSFLKGEEKYRNLANAINEEVKRAMLS